MTKQNEPSQVDCAYAAGFFDGEGCILLRRHQMRRCRSKLFTMTVGICQDDPQPLVWMQNRWGGFVRPRLIRSSGRTAHDLFLHSEYAAVFLRDVLPYLIVKRDQATLALELRAALHNPGSVGYSVDEIESIEVLALRLKSVKHRIHPALPKHIAKVGRAKIIETGQRFGAWIVLGRADIPDAIKSPGRRSGSYWKCRCICGRERVIYGSNLRLGVSHGCRSCSVRQAKTKHPDVVPLKAKRDG